MGESLDSVIRRMNAIPVRQDSANGEPKPTTSIERTCRSCGASFLQLAPGRTGERGLWVRDWVWVCSEECKERFGADARRTEEEKHED